MIELRRGFSLASTVVLAIAYWGPSPAEGTQQGAAARDYDVQDRFLQWPLPPGGESYAAIDGRRLHEYVVEQAEISRRYRDRVNPQFWGRIIGTSSDAESAEWLLGKFREIGLSDVRTQSLDLAPQWMPRSWKVSVTAGAGDRELVSAQPFYRSSGTPPEGLDLEAVYVGLGSEADFAGRDVKGKAVFAFSMPGLRDEGALRRADARGAAAVFDVVMLPGNMRYQAYPGGTAAPAFSLGSEDGYAVRDAIVDAAGGRAPRVHVALDVRMTPGLKTALVWGTLPGRTDETIYVVAHRDGWFEASGDNAGGVASMIGLAEYYAKIPQAERRRTMVFIGLDGHHNTGEGSGVGRQWLVDHRNELFAKTALVINCEHPSTVQTTVRPRYTSGEDIVWTNTYTGQQWYAGGPARPELQAIAASAFREFGVTTYLEPNPQPPAGDLGRLYRFVPGVATSDFLHYFHTDEETPETVPWTGLEASTRAYARIIDAVNDLDLRALQRPPEPER
jgi:Peptidase family M28